MPILSPLIPRCDRCPCPATVKLQSRWTSWIGQFCADCGQVAYSEEERRETQYHTLRPQTGHNKNHPTYP
jgi:hypothetical protein